MTRTLVWSVVVTLALVLLAWYAFPYFFEQRSQTVIIAPSKAALKNPYLAAQRLLVRMGGSAQRVQVPYEVFKSEKMNVLIIPARRSSPTQTWLKQLRHWVQAGGHVVVESEYFSVPDPLLDAWNIDRSEVDHAGHNEIYKNNQKQDYVVRVHVPGRDGTYRLNLIPNLSLAAPQSQALSQDQAGVYVLQLQEGAGKITVMSQMEFFTNRSIGNFDHAEFLWSLVRGESTPHVTILDLQGLSLTDWLVHHAWPVLLTLSILIMLWLWRVLPRFGPIVPDPLPENRRLHEHLLASGRLLWHAGLVTLLSNHARQAAMRLVHKQNPFFSDLSSSQQAELLRQRYGLNPAQIHDFMQSHTPHSQDEFIRWVRLCCLIQQYGKNHTFTTTGQL